MRPLGVLPLLLAAVLLHSAPAHAQEAGGLAGLFGGSQLISFLPIVLVFVVFWFLLLRPQQQQQKALKAQLATLKRNDRVVTAGGMLGTITRVRDGQREVELEVAPNIRVTVLRETISSVYVPQPANDAKPAGKSA